jgi:MFS family permease
MPVSRLRPDFRWISSGFLLMFFSGFGQTFYIAIFAGHLKADLAITDGQFGSLYTIGTLGSAAILVWAGKFADRFPIRHLGIAVMSGLALAALAMASVTSAWMLAFALFGLRFFGQGMMVHVAMTGMARWFNRRRGRAISIAVLGFSASEAAMPLIAVAAIGLVGWRLAWVAAAAALAVLAMPVLAALLARDRIPAVGTVVRDAEPRSDGMREWTRREVLRSPLFYALMPGLLAPSFVMTGIFFNQVTIVEVKGWQLSWFAASFPVMAGMSVLSALAAGWTVDRFGARRLLPAVLIPIGLATLILTYASAAYVLPLFMALVGLAHGGASTVQGALWAELYGTGHVGAIRSVVAAGMVFASALSPGLIGILLDAGVSLHGQFVAMGVYCLVAALWMGTLAPRLDRLAAA